MQGISVKMLTAKYAKFKCGRTPPGTEAKRDFIVTFPLAEVLFRPYKFYTCGRIRIRIRVDGEHEN